MKITVDDLNNLTALVKQILEKDYRARNSDNYLYVQVAKKINPQAVSMPFINVMYGMKDLDLPSIESVGRCRRKIQEKHPELWSDKQIQKYREEQEKTFEDYARS